MTEFLQLSLTEFAEQTASAAPVPGGGGAAAYSGALGMALVDMVANLTIGKKKYADVEEEVRGLLARGEEIRESLLLAVEQDAAAFEPLSRAYGLPAGTDEEKAAKAAELSACSRVAADVPLLAMEQALEGLKIARRIAEVGSRLVISDAACGAALLLAAINSFSFTARINLGAIDDKAYVEGANDRLAEIAGEAAVLEQAARCLATERML